MAVVKVIEVIATSKVSFEDAVKEAVKEVSKTIRNIDSVWIKDQKVHVSAGKIASWGVVCKVSFRIESAPAPKAAKPKAKAKK
jgi:dodecin